MCYQQVIYHLFIFLHLYNLADSCKKNNVMDSKDIINAAENSDMNITLTQGKQQKPMP